MDDTLVATGALWRDAEQTLLRHLGRKWTEELALNYKGMNALDVAATIHRLVQPAVALSQCQKIMRDALLGSFRGREPRAMDGAVDCVKRLWNSAPLAVASGSPLEAIELSMQRLGIRECFKVLISSESVPRGKPHPDVFLAAAAALQVEPARCLVFEDSLIGVRAALAAGMQCFAVPSTHPEEIRALATRTFPSLADVNPPL